MRDTYKSKDKPLAYEVTAPFGLENTEPSNFVGVHLTHGQLEKILVTGELQR